MAGNTVRLKAVLDDKVSGPLERIRDNFDRLGGKGSAASLFGNVGAKAVAKGFDLIGDAASVATKFVFDSIDAASNLAEATSKSAAVFGPASKDLEDWAATASNAFGQSKRQALEAAGTFGNLIQAFGLGADQAADMSTKMVELASDLASFNNTTVDEALIALRAGLTGETEPLKRFGVALNDVRLKEEALRLGLIKTAKGTLPIAIKTQAAYSLILKDTSIAQGDFDRTSDGLANTQKTLTAQMEDLSAQIGEELLPFAVSLAQAIRDDVIPALQDAGETADELSDGPLGSLVGALLNLAGGMHDVSPASDQLVQDFYEAQEAAEAEAEALALLAKHMRDATKDDSALRESVEKTTPEVHDAVQEFSDLIDEIKAGKDPMDELTDALGAFYDEIIENRYEPEQLRLRLKELNRELKDEKAALKELEEIKDPTADQRRDIIDTKLRVSELNEDIDKTKVKIGLLDGASLTELRATFRTLKKNGVDPLSAEMEHVWDLIRKAYTKVKGINPTAPPTGGAKKKASGGPVDPDELYLVGEEGPELFMSKTAGTIIPNDVLTGASGGSSGSGWSPPTVRPTPVVIHSHLYLDGHEIAAAVEAAGYYDSAVASTAGGPA